jgi:hypothetical protein
MFTTSRETGGGGGGAGGRAGGPENYALVALQILSYLHEFMFAIARATLVKGKGCTYVEHSKDAKKTTNDL